MGTSYVLNPDQVLLCTPGSTWSDTLTVQDRTWNVAGTVDEFPSSGIGVKMVGDPALVVVPSVEDMEYVRSLAPDEQKSLVNILAFDSPNPDQDAAAVKDQFEQITGLRPSGDTRNGFGDSLHSLYGSLLFVGIFVSILFITASVLIMYYKQISEGYEDQKRFDIMTRVGLDNAQIRKTIHFQVLAVFFLPLVMAAVHIAFAFPMISKLLMLLGMGDTTLFMITCLCVFGIFALLYVIVYGLTSRAYYQLVKGMTEDLEEA